MRWFLVVLFVFINCVRVDVIFEICFGVDLYNVGKFFMVCLRVYEGKRGFCKNLLSLMVYIIKLLDLMNFVF